ncbi:2Fe-2S iron-sulfur cluster binding domain-containing protein [Pseudomaricurvus alkylphenolicus]|uniref:2Fe-2S iron-sulfur cluster-binding protein n=1 Tax=Pseudomaricurvus alkylphenolicus TaxID=1306991 RepID=UPI00141F6346|nr:2Fe-2S iron-sulfur cluster-binding protein [Pseudomaricurvus alkylphenolicus]NIB44901.1 2Fe-2S iron-sulfur cluster binding domain-containing protein [Pseudomaricurvus alkylphenolicus]
MPLITYIEADGTEHKVDVATDTTLMQGAVNHMIDAIAAECGGAGTCATCHCYVDENWREKITAPSDMEAQMLELVMEPRDNSRLSCQIKVDADMEGMVVRLPEAQY